MNTSCGMSPLNTLAQSSPKRSHCQDSYSVENSHDLDSCSALPLAPCRAPLCPIPLPSQVADGLGNGDSSLKAKLQASTPRSKSKLQPRSDNPSRTPDRHITAGIAALGRNRFGWQQARFQAISGSDKDACFSAHSPNGKLGLGSPRLYEGKEIRTPSKLLRSASCSEASHSSNNGGVLESQLNSHSVQPCLLKTGSSNQSTPRSTRSSRSAINDAGYSGSTQLTGTPTRTVSRTLKYTMGNCSSSSNVATGTRAGLPGLRLCGPQTVRSAQLQGSDYHCADASYFDVEEDPLFWNDHNVQVLIRCRPLNTSEIASQGYSRCLRQESAHTLTYIGQPEARFTFDHVACEKITQEKLFIIAGKPMVDNCMSGYNSCMFAYGQTGSGKTHTMLGDITDLDQRPSDNRGMTPRIFEYLFCQISTEEKMRKDERLKFTCKCSFLEIYNEQITDLLEPSSTNLQMREDVKKGVYVENLSEVEVTSVQDVVFLLLQGAANRRVASTNMNRESSRSHSVFTCIIESKWESDSMTNLRFGRLNLVDLAGSERQKSSGAEGERLKEAANINKSLSTLGLVIMILVDVAQGKQRHVPYRDSKLTFLLQDSLGGNSKTTIIANVSPSMSCASETLSTLKFAQRAKFIRNNAIINEDASGDVLALRLQIQQLKEELNRLSRQSISRLPLYNLETRMLDLSNKDCSDGVSADGGHFSSSFERVENAETNLKKVKALEAVVAGSLRREQVADNTVKRLTEEIEQLNCLVRQREDDAQFNKMMLRFREDKIKRLEASLGGTLCGESCKAENQDALKEELELMRSRLDKNPEVTRFAMENIRLREQLQRWQNFYEAGERDILVEEVSHLRGQLSDYLEAELATPKDTSHHVTGNKNARVLDSTASGISLDEDPILKLESQLQEKQERLQWEAYKSEELSCQLDDARRRIKILENELKESIEAVQELSGRLQLSEASLTAAQETAAAAQATVKPIRLETEDIALQQRHSFSEIQEATSAWRLEEMQLRSQLEEAQSMINELSMQKDLIALDNSAADPTLPKTAETVMHLQMELEAMESLIKEERIHRGEAEERRSSLERRLEQSEEICKGLRGQVEEAEFRNERLREDLDSAEEKELETCKRLLELSEDLNHHKMVIEALENQALLSIDETTNLQAYNSKLDEELKRKEDDLKKLTGCVVFLQSELQRELEVKVIQMDTNKGDHCSSLKEKLERTKRALQQAEKLNAKLQNEQNSFKAIEHQRDLVRADAETETTEAITVLQSELVSLCEDHRIIQERELKAEQKVMQLQIEVLGLTSKMEALSEENNHLKSLYRSALDEKDVELTKLTQDWEMAASSLIEYLCEGNQALIDATQEIDRCSEECLSPSSLITTCEKAATCKAEDAEHVLEKRLLHAQKLARQTEDKVRILSGASLAIADMQNQERKNMSELEALNLLLVEKLSQIQCLSVQARNSRARAERSDTMFLVSCIVIDKFSKAISDLTTENQRLQHVMNAVIEEKGAELVEKEKMIHDLHGHMQIALHDKAIAVDNCKWLEVERDTTKANLNLAEKQIQELKWEMISRDEKCAKLADTVQLANSFVADNVVGMVEIQLLKDLLSLQGKLAEESLLQNQVMYAESGAGYQTRINKLCAEVCWLEARNAALLDDLKHERGSTAQLREAFEVNKVKFSAESMNLEKELIAAQEQLAWLTRELEQSILEVVDLRGQKEQLVEELRKSNLHATEIGAELEGMSSEYSVTVYSVFMGWLEDAIASVMQTELLQYQLQLLMEDSSVSEVRLQALESHCDDGLAYLEEECMTITRKIAETDIIVEELENKLQASYVRLKMSETEKLQAKKDEAHLSMNLGDLTVDLACHKFTASLQMDIITDLLIQQFQEERVQFTFEVVEAKKLSAELTTKNSENTAKLEELTWEVAMLKDENMKGQEVSKSLAEELSENHDQLQLLKAQAEQAQIRCEGLVFHFKGIQEDLFPDIFLLVFEEAILREMLVSQRALLEGEASVFSSNFHGLQRNMQEYMENVDLLRSENAMLQEEKLKLSQENQELLILCERIEQEWDVYEEVQRKVVKGIDGVEVQKAKLLVWLSDFDGFLASSQIEQRHYELYGVLEDCQLMLNNLEALIPFTNMVTEDLEVSQAKQIELALGNKAIELKVLSEKTLVLERENNNLQEEKHRREAGVKALQLLCQQQEIVDSESGKLLEEVEGNEMKLTELQFRIQRMTDWISKEIGNDFKMAFREGCQMVLNAVEKEVQTCREQAEIAWKKVDAVLHEKRELQDNLLKRNELVEELQYELTVLKDHVGATNKESDEIRKLSTLITQMQRELDEKRLFLVKLEDEVSVLQHKCTLASARVDELEAILSEQKESLFLVKNENTQLRSQLEEMITVKEFNKVTLEDKQHAIQVLEMQVLRLNSLLEDENIFSLGHISKDLNEALKERDLAIKERDELHADLVVLSEQLEMAQQIAEEHEGVAVEARQIAEASKTRAEQKEEEARLLERSVEELESTVNALETEVGIVRSETERQRLMREDTEMELQDLKHQLSLMQAHPVDNEVLQAKLEQMQRDMEEKETKLLEAEQKISILDKQCEEKNQQIRKYKSDMIDIISEANRQASDHNQIIKTLETMAEERSLVQAAMISKQTDRCAIKPRGSGSPFKCMGSGLAHQMSIELDEELSCNRQKIEELEALANSRQKEIFLLNVRLAEAESMTHDVIRDLVGVKLDITNYAEIIRHHQGQNNVRKPMLQSELAKEKETELIHLKTRLNEFIEERESWLEEINRRQAEMMTARVAAEKLRQRDQLLSSEIETLRMENYSQRSRLVELEEEVNKLSGQQNLQQRIHHHAKIKEENNQLRLKNEDLATKLRRSEVLLNRIGDELARYREADGKTPYVDFEEEQRLKLKLQEVEEEKLQIAQELLTLCTSVLQIAGFTSAKAVDHTVAAEALKHLQVRLDTADREISDLKLKDKIESEKRRLSELRSLQSPVPATRVSLAQQCTSP